MRTIERYIFGLIAALDDIETTKTVHPHYDSLKIKNEREDGKYFYTQSLEGELMFLADDFDFIHGKSVRAKFTLIVRDIVSNTDIISITFRKTDGETDVDHKMFSLSTSQKNEYDFLDKFDNEYNLHDLHPMVKPITFTADPVTQVFEYRKLYMWNTVGKTPYQRQINTDIGTFDELVGNLFVGDLQRPFLPLHPASLTIHNGADEYMTLPATRYQNAQWMFVGESDMIPEGQTFGYRTFNVYVSYIYKNDTASNPYYLWMFMEKEPHQGSQMVFYDLSTATQGNPIRPATNNHLLLADEDGTEIPFQWWEARQGVFVGQFYTLADMLSAKKCMTEVNPPVVMDFVFRTFAKRSIYYSEGGSDDYRVPSQEQGVFANKNYNYYHLYALGGFWTECGILASNNISDTPTEYGKTPDGEHYYDKPTDDTKIYYPIMQDSWGNSTSVWMTTNNDIEGPIADITINHWTTLGDAIKLVLAEIDKNIAFEEDENHSKFLFSDINPVSYLPQGKLYITQKSNLLNFQYTLEAWKAPISMNKILELVSNNFNCGYDFYKDTEGRTHLRIEHVSFYMNGHSYGGGSKAVLDLRNIYDSRNQKPLSYRTNRWSYSIGGNDNTYSRYEFSWMDEQSRPFDGYPIEVPEEYDIFSNRRTKTLNTSLFSSDVQYLIAMPNYVSKDGFIIIMTDPNNEDVVCRGNVLYEKRDVELQNFMLCNMFMHDKFWKHGLYAEKIRINDDRVVVVQKRGNVRKSEVAFTIRGNVRVSPYSNIITDAGEGEIRSLELDLSSETITAVVYYPTEK